MNEENGLQGKNRKIVLYIRHVYLVLFQKYFIHRFHTIIMTIFFTNYVIAPFLSTFDCADSASHEILMTAHDISGFSHDITPSTYDISLASHDKNRVTLI